MLTIMQFLYIKYIYLLLLALIGERAGKRVGSLKCKGNKCPSVRGYQYALQHWLKAFGQTEQYSEVVVRDEAGNPTKIVGKGNPFTDPGERENIVETICTVVVVISSKS